MDMIKRQNGKITTVVANKKKLGKSKRRREWVNRLLRLILSQFKGKKKFLCASNYNGNMDKKMHVNNLPRWVFFFLINKSHFTFLDHVLMSGEQ